MVDEGGKRERVLAIMRVGTGGAGDGMLEVVASLALPCLRAGAKIVQACVRVLGGSNLRTHIVIPAVRQGVFPVVDIRRAGGDYQA